MTQRCSKYLCRCVGSVLELIRIVFVSDESSSSIMANVWANASCDPFTDPSTPCLLGNYVRYAINVTEPAHIVAGLEFVKKHNVRLVIRNTGHEYVCVFNLLKVFSGVMLIFASSAAISGNQLVLVLLLSGPTI